MPILKVKQNGEWVVVGDGMINAETLEGKPASYFAAASDVEALQSKIDNFNLPDQINADTVDGMHADEFVHTTGGTLTGTLTINGIVLTEGVDYGTDDPSGGVVGQLYFKKVT